MLCSSSQCCVRMSVQVYTLYIHVQYQSHITLFVYVVSQQHANTWHKPSLVCTFATSHKLAHEHDKLKVMKAPCTQCNYTLL